MTSLAAMLGMMPLALALGEGAEMLQALASKGYFHGEPNGEWGPDSADALKRFQAEQNLTPDGKLTSLSLIALGLGPKRLTAQTHAPSAADATKPEVPK